MLVDIEKKIADNKNILTDIHLNLENQGLVFIIGKSGAGKTTLLNIIAGNDSDFTGTVKLDQNIETDSKDYRKNLDLINQDFNLIGSINVEDNIRLGAQIAGRNITDGQFMETCQKLGIDHLLKRKINLLSGGEKQRVAIARALLRNNSVLLADEPTGNLDSSNSKAIYDIFKQLSLDRLIIVVSHDLQAAEKYADRIIELSDGKIIADNLKKSKADNLSAAIQENSSVNTKWKWNYVFKGILSRKKQLSGVLLTVGFSMCVIFTILGLYSGIKTMKTTLDKEILENDKFEFNQLKAAEMVEHDGINVSVLTDVSNNQYIDYAFAFYQTTVKLINEDRTADVTYQVVEINDYFYSRYSNLNGRLPEKENEIIIDDALANKLFDSTDAIGKSVILSYLSQEYEVIVTAVKKNYNTNASNGTLIITSELAEKIYQSECHKMVYLSNGTSYLGKGCEVVSIDKLSNTSNIIQGKRPTEYGEIVISLDVVNMVLQNVNNQQKLYAEADILQGNANNEIFTQYYLLTHSMERISNVKIVGITDDNSAGIFYGDWYDVAPYSCNVIYAYANDLSDVSIQSILDLAEKNDCYAGRNSTLITSMVTSQVVLLIGILTVVGVLFLILATLMINGFMKLSIERRRYEIGVLASLGNSNSEIARMLVTEQCLTASALAIVVFFIWTVFGVFILEPNLRYNGLMIFDVELWHYMVVLLILFITMVIMSLPEILKATRSNITLAIATRYD